MKVWHTYHFRDTIKNSSHHMKKCSYSCGRLVTKSKKSGTSKRLQQNTKNSKISSANFPREKVIKLKKQNVDKQPRTLTGGLTREAFTKWSGSRTYRRSHHSIVIGFGKMSSHLFVAKKVAALASPSLHCSKLRSQVMHPSCRLTVKGAEEFKARLSAWSLEMVEKDGDVEKAFVAREMMRWFLTAEITQEIQRSRKSWQSPSLI